MKQINIFDVKRAINKGQIEVLVNKGIIYLNDPISGECAKIGSVKGDEKDEDPV